MTPTFVLASPWSVSALGWISVLLFLGGIGAIATIVLMVKVLASAARRRAEAAIARQRERVLGLFERAERLRARLERFSGDDEPEPSGRTREDVEAVRRQLRELMDRWTEQHGKLERAEELFGLEHWISNAHFEQARQVALACVEACDQILPLAADAERIMDRLENAPERALRAISALRCEVGARLPGAEEPITAEQIARFERQLRPDPLGVAEEAERLLQGGKAR